MTVVLLVIEYLLSEPSFHTVNRRLRAYLLFVRKTFVNPACISVLSLIYGRHHAGSAIFMPRSRKTLGTVQGPPRLYRPWRVWHTRSLYTPRRTGEKLWRQLDLSG